MWQCGIKKTRVAMDEYLNYYVVLIMSKVLEGVVWCIYD